MGVEQRRDLAVVLLDGFGQHWNLFDQGLDHHRRGQNNGFISSQGLSLLDVFRSAV